MSHTLTAVPLELLFMVTSYLDLHSIHSLVLSSRHLYNTLKLVLWSRMDPTPTLLWAASHSIWSLIPYALRRGADPTAKYNSGPLTALHHAASYGHEPSITALLDAGANVNAHGSGRGITPLLSAIEKNHVGAVKLLIDRGAYIAGALEYPCMNGNVEMAALLLEKGAEVNRYMEGPLIIAIRYGRAEIARLLCRWGADVGERDRNGFKAAQLAVMSGIDLGDAGRRGKSGRLFCVDQENINIGSAGSSSTVIAQGPAT